MAKRATSKAGKLKVYVTPAGFDDAYVAASSQKAALAKWCGCRAEPAPPT